MIKKILFLLLFPSILFAQYGHGIVWKSVAGNIYYNNGNVGIGTTAPGAKLHIYQDSPSANQVLFQIGTSDAANRFSIDEDGDVTQTGGIAESLGNFIISSEANLLFLIDSNANQNNRNITFGSNSSWDPLVNPLMIIKETGNVGIETTAPDSATLQIASGIGVHDFYIGDATTWSRIDAGGGVVTSSDSTKKRNIVRVDSLIKVNNLFQKVLITGIYQWQWNPDSIFVKFDSSFVTGWDTLTVSERDSIRQSYIAKETKRVNNIARFKHYSPLAQEFGSIWLNKPNNKKLDWQLIAVINWYTNQQIIKEIMAIKQKIGL